MAKRNPYKTYRRKNKQQNGDEFFGIIFALVILYFILKELFGVSLSAFIIGMALLFGVYIFSKAK